MFATLVSIVIAYLLHRGPFDTETFPHLEVVAIIIISAGTLFLLLPTLVFSMGLAPLQNAEQNTTPHLIGLLRRDRFIKIAQWISLLFPLASYFVAIDILFLKLISNNIILPAWIILFGLALDTLYAARYKLAKYLDPFQAVDIFAKEAHKSVVDDHVPELCDWMDALSETSLRATMRNSFALSNHAINSIQRTTRTFLEASKIMTHHEHPKQDRELGIADEVSYTLYFILQRLEVVNNKAAAAHLEPICSNLVTTLGKMAIDSAKCDISLPAYPLQCLGRFTTTAQRHGLSEVGVKATFTLLEVAKAILTEVDIKYAELQPPFFSLITQLEAIAKETYRQDKDVNIALLAQPFQELKMLFADEKMAAHQDTPAILSEINRVLAEFAALDSMLRTMPPIPKEVGIV